MVAATTLRSCCVIFALVFASGFLESSANDNFSRPFALLSDQDIGSFLKSNPSLSAELSDMHLMRYVNEHERVMKGLVVPLLFDQRVTLLVSRFHNFFSGWTTDPFLDKFIDTIDEAAWPTFLLQFIVAPSYPLYTTFRQYDSQSTFDETLQFVFALLSLIEFLRFSAFVLNLKTSMKTSGASFWSCVLDADNFRAPVASFAVVGISALLSHRYLWNPSIFCFIPLIFTTVVSLYFGNLLKKATSNIFLGFLSPIACHIVAYYFVGAEAYMEFMLHSPSEIPLKIVSNCVLMALPFWYIRQAQKSMKSILHSIGWFARLQERDRFIIPPEEISFDKARVLGQGGCGTVILAKYFCSNVAVKFVNPDEKGRAPSARDVKQILEEVQLLRSQFSIKFIELY